MDLILISIGLIALLTIIMFGKKPKEINYAEQSKLDDFYPVESIKNYFKINATTSGYQFRLFEEHKSGYQFRLFEEDKYMVSEENEY